MSRKTKLELTWVGKENRPRLEPRVLIDVPQLSHTGGVGIMDNLLVQGDNLLALKALEADFTGGIKCVYIDPPFNTQQAFPNYDDGLEHSIWLSLLRDRLEVIFRLLSKDGTIFVHIDDNELAYLTILMDEVFGRANRVSIVTFKQGSATGHKSINPGVVSTSNFVLIYARDKANWKPNRIFVERSGRDTRYAQFISNVVEHYSEWTFTTLSKAFSAALGLPEKGLKKELGDEYEAKICEFVHTNAKAVIRSARPDYNAISSVARETIDLSKQRPKTVMRLERDGELSDMYFHAGERILFYSDKLKLIDGKFVAGEPLTSIWDDILSNNLHNEGGVDFPKGKKPEALIKRCIDLSTNPGDLVLDSFAGSGTTGAVAHKMGRRWIMVEIGDHAQTHIVPRLRKVIDGTDAGGVTATTNWQGGGGFRFCRLAPSLITRDKWGREVISAAYDGPLLAQALCKIKGFRYDPSESDWWAQGKSSDTDFLHVTTQTLSHDQLAELSELVGEGRTLLILCAAWRGDERAFPNLTVSKIPDDVLKQCDFGREDYGLPVTGDAQ